MEHTQEAAPKARTKRRFWRYTLIVLCLLLIIGGIAAALWLRPYPASDEARAALRTDARVQVSEDSDQIAFIPHDKTHIGLIFYPGAKVDPAAYSIYMRALAERGYATFIVKMPLNFAILDANKAERVISAHPEITTWAIGGHSLGGVMASDFVSSHSNIKGLLFYGAYPNNDISRKTGVTVFSLYGTHDGLSTPAKVNAARPKMPPNARYIAIDGGIHSYFGDYGLQDGDGQPGIPRQQARQQIINASLTFMEQCATNAA